MKRPTLIVGPSHCLCLLACAEVAMLTHTPVARDTRPTILPKSCPLWPLQELEKRIRVDAPAARQELLLTIEGMQCVRLGLATDARVLPPPYCNYISAKSYGSIPASHAMVSATVNL